MSQRKHRPLLVERLDDRITPAVDKTIVSFKVTDTNVGPTTWTAPDPPVNTVIGSHNLEATMTVRYTLSKEELARARAAGTGFILDDEIRWREEDAGQPTDDDVARTFVSYAIKLAPPITFDILTFAPANWQTTNAANADGDGVDDDAEYYGWVNDPDSVINYKSDLIVLQNGASVAGGAQAGKAAQTPGIGESIAAVIPSPDLPTLPAGSGGYRLLSFDSADGVDFTFTAANSTDYGLFAASSPHLVEDAEGEAVLDTATTLNPIFIGGTAAVGAYSGSNKDLVLRPNAGGAAHILSGHSYSAVPSSLLSLADGQTATVGGDDIAAGTGMLWLFYDAGDETHGFVLVPTASSGPTLTVSDVTVTEGNSGTTNATFTVTLSAAAASDVTVQYATAGGTATSGTDFTATSGTLTFTPGQTSKTVTVPVVGDIVDESNEDFFLTLGGATNAVIADGVGLGTIADDDGLAGPPGGGSGPALTVSDVTVAEGNGGTTNAVFTITLSPAATSTVTVTYGTAGGTATSGTDFAETTGTVTFAPGETSKTVTVPVIGDTIVEPDEDFSLMIGSTGAAIADGTGQGTITDDDGPPAVSIEDVRQAEGDSGTTTFVFTVTLSHPSWQTITLSFATAAGSATAGTDFEATSGTLTFQPGETTKTITVTVYGDTTVEGLENFAVNLSGVSNATLADPQGLGLIENDD